LRVYFLATASSIPWIAIFARSGDSTPLTQ
jgi:hypothetical protein